MFGNHKYEDAVKLAASKTAELGHQCRVVPAAVKDGPRDLFTIAVPVGAFSPDELKMILTGTLLMNR